MDLSNSHQSYFSNNYKMANTRKRFFSGSSGEGSSSSSSSDLPVTNTAPLSATSSSPPSSGNLRLAPGRSLSSSAALLRQRGATASPDNSSSKPVKRASSENLDGLLHLKGPYSDSYYYQQYYYDNTTAVSTTWGFLVQATFVFAFMGLCLFGRMVHESNYELTHLLQLRDHEIDHHMEHTRALEKKVQRLRDESIHLTQQIESLEGSNTMGNMMELQRKVFHMEHAQNIVHQGIQISDKRKVKERFGPGPHYYVELTLDPTHLPDTSPDENTSLLLETAHIDDMPHSIHLFLEQVSHKLYDGAAFHRSANHILQAGPMGHSGHAKFQRQASLQSVLFQEYSTNFPHAQYTLGYPGRPGGPDFYLNVKDNTQLHGPGGQQDHYYYDQEHPLAQADADPCFAKVIQGFHVIQRLRQAPVVDWQDVMVHPILIQRMRVVSKAEYQQEWKHNSSDDDNSSEDEEEEPAVVEPEQEPEMMF